jgi:DNA-binding transcriptional regulator YdaS (Cro superfamily)
MVKREMNDPVKRAIDAAGGLRPLARKLGIGHTAVFQWRKIPLHHLFRVEEITGLSREELRPDIFQQARPVRKFVEQG